MKVDIIVGARPNFIKAASLFLSRKYFPNLKLRLIHTGQHYDYCLSGLFLNQLKLPKPVCCLEVGSGSHAFQTAMVMLRYEKWIRKSRPDLCVVLGDVNSTLACALVAAKHGIKIAHVEAGLRSFDRSMPEEINRILTDALSDLMFVTEYSGLKNLIKEGRPRSNMYLVGNTMIDSLLFMLPKIKKIQLNKLIPLKSKDFAYLTLHRPSNVDNKRSLSRIVEQVLWLADKMPVVFPVHPRTEDSLKRIGLYAKIRKSKSIYLLKPVGYLESLALLLNSKLVVTDSGGIQEEAAFLKIPCFTLRKNTERPITTEMGMNKVIDNDWNLFHKCVKEIRAGVYKTKISRIPYWDGYAGKRILTICNKAFKR